MAIAYVLGCLVKPPLIRIESLLIFVSAIIYNLVFTFEFYQNEPLLSRLSSLLA